MTQTDPKLRLAEHVRACLVGDQLILLDLLRSKYIGVGGLQSHALSAALLGVASADCAQASTSNLNILDECVRRLRSHQLLSNDPTVATPRTPALPEPIESLCTDDAPDAGLDWRQLPSLWKSTWITWAWLRRLSLADIANRVIALRARHAHQGGAAPAALRDAVGAYMRLRPFALTAHDRCLNDSLMLVHFLACQGIISSWVIGVSVHPFCAHSWVQSEGVVLNDLPEHVRRYRPILVV